MKKLIPALALLLVSAVVMSTASYAWFSMNRTVSATGMSLTSTAPANLLITNTQGENEEFAHNVWKSSVAASEVYTGKLYPASTYNGRKFFAVADGQTIGDNNIGGVAESGKTKFITNTNELTPLTGSSDGYWAEYTFYFKTTGASDLNVYLSEINYYIENDSKYLKIDSEVGVTEVAGLYTKNNDIYTQITNLDAKAENGTDYYTTIEDSVRVALFTVKRNESGVVESETLVGVYDLGARDTVDPISNVNPDDGSFETGNDFDNFDNSNKLAENDGAPTKYESDNCTFTVEGNEKITELLVVVWIEGQNPKCVNAVAGDGFNIAFTFSIASESAS